MLLVTPCTMYKASSRSRKVLLYRLYILLYKYNDVVHSNTMYYYSHIYYSFSYPTISMYVLHSISVSVAVW